MTMRSLSGPDATALAELAAPRSRQLANHRGLRADDITDDPRFAADTAESPAVPAAPVRSLLAVPIVSRSGDVLGAMVFGHRDRAVFTSRDERMVRGIAAQAAIAIDNARLVRDLRLDRAAALRGQLEFTRSITDSVGEGLYAVDRFQAGPRSSTRRPRRCWGTPPSKWSGKTSHELIHFRHADSIGVSPRSVSAAVA